MAKKRPSPGLTNLERFGGGIFFVFYLLLLPLMAGPARHLAGELLGRRISEELYGAVYYYGLFAVTAILFHRLLGTSTRRFLDEPARALKTAGVGIVAYYGLGELAARLGSVFVDRSGNLNDAVISARTGSAPHMTLLIVVFLAPFVEETLFRGLVFGGLKEKSRLLAYAVSCALFALVHVWQFALANRDPAYFLAMVQYLIPGLVLAWAYEHSGTLWASIGLHAGVNALSALAGSL
ncbi:CPBP family intramembrane glutamic endopeptidase [uncultured Oscillibacter sp.]|uniref:CPBP family intramembrane glutamic endopeptidase n=1 Tax=uncultured Oscillibacter sp. TaxID=876091 RepID=UPI00260DA970|nr:CPBP family intramembrane glutamic endopeptidase [uncultured Oscillibacter sp.]